MLDMVLLSREESGRGILHTILCRSVTTGNQLSQQLAEAIKPKQHKRGHGHDHNCGHEHDHERGLGRNLSLVPIEGIPDGAHVDILRCFHRDSTRELHDRGAVACHRAALRLLGEDWRRGS